MKLIACLMLACITLLPTTISAKPSANRKMAFWFPRTGPKTFRSGNLKVKIAPAPCRTGQPDETEGCRWDKVNNQAIVTVEAPGVEPLRLLTNSQADYYRLAIVRIDRRDSRAGVVIVDDSGGSAGLAWVHVIVPDGNGYKRVDLRLHGDETMTYFAEEVPSDLSGDGRIDFVTHDSRFGMVDSCNACRPTPPVVLTIRDGESVDISTDPAVRHVLEQNMALLRPLCLSDDPERNGACAAFVADAARAGQFDAAWKAMLRHYNRTKHDFWTGSRGGPHYADFPAALHAYLTLTGYIRA